MKKFIMTCGKEVLLDDEDYEKLPKTGWSLVSHKIHNSNTDYAEHDVYGKMHRYILGYLPGEASNITIDHINHNGLDNRRENLREVTTSQNKRNVTTHYPNNFLHYSGVNFEKQPNKRCNRFRAKWSEGDPERCDDGERRAKQKTKSFSYKKGNRDECEDALKQAILFRNQKARENGYILDERSTTIERAIKEDKQCDIERFLEINIDSLLY